MYFIKIVRSFHLSDVGFLTLYNFFSSFSCILRWGRVGETLAYFGDDLVK